MQAITQNLVNEWAFTSSKQYADPFNDVDMHVVYTSENGQDLRVPAFWAGGSVWRVRFSSPTLGRYRFRTVCSDSSNADLHGVEGEFEVVPYTGQSELLSRGRIQTSQDHRHFEHTDGTPFFWLADTWWMALSKRLDWPTGFQVLTNDRLKKGFNVIQIVMGPYPDMDAFDARGESEAGFPWEEGFARVNLAYYDLADIKIRYLIEMGLVPCIVGCWAYYLPTMGVEKVKKHWRNLIARYGAYPVVWCLAGELELPYYMADNKEELIALQKKGWTEVAQYVHETDPFHNLITIHPVNSARNEINDPSLLDFNMLQTGHADRYSLPNTIELVTEAYDANPTMPFINSEVCYEGIGEACRQEVQRYCFWSCMLSGAAGHTYGANGIWQFNNPEKPYGPSPHGMSWGETPWEEAYRLPGSGHVGLGKRLLERYEWHKFEPHPEWIQPRWSKENYIAPFAAGIPGKVRVVYFPFTWTTTGTVKDIEPGVKYYARLISPIDGSELDLDEVKPDANGDWELPCGNPPWKMMPVFQDWVLVIEALS